jgi:hypothetical protein
MENEQVNVHYAIVNVTNYIKYMEEMLPDRHVQQLKAQYDLDGNVITVDVTFDFTEK